MLPPSLRAGDLDQRIKQVLVRPEYKRSRWGLLVVDDETGKPIFQHNADDLYAPASVTKLFTCAAVLAEFGAEYRFQTPVYRRGKMLDGTLKGDLILVAKGDPTLGGRTDAHGRLVFRNLDHTYADFISTQPDITDTDPLAGLRALARQVRDRGIREIEGDVLIDARLFVPTFSTGSGPRIVTPIIVNDNVLDVVISPGKTEGERATARIRPENGFIHVDVQVQTGAKESTPSIVVEFAGPDRYVVRGTIPLDSKPLVRICPITNPELFARGLFIETLRREGVRVQASALRQPTASLPDADAYAGLTRVANLESPPMSELLKVTMKVSHNLYASTLPMLLAVKHGKRTLAEGMQLEGKILSDLGVKIEDLTLESGAGGGSCDRVTPRVVVQLLRAMARRSDFDVFRSTLPILGVDGTLADVVDKDSPIRGKVMAKTGTYGDRDLLNERPFLRSKSLAGFLTTKNGRRLTFAILVNDVPLGPGVTSVREAKTIAHLCEILYLHAPAKEEVRGSRR
jgi:D-alanyl-D-alanine carboxypeptidase/D-alanyl-D-alanine-endopeptidase (penicillin-binding protein 4)